VARTLILMRFSSATGPGSPHEGIVPSWPRVMTTE